MMEDIQRDAVDQKLVRDTRAHFTENYGWSIRVRRTKCEPNNEKNHAWQER